MNAVDTSSKTRCFEAIDITKDYSGVPVLLGVSLSLSPGEVIGLVGHNGAGKSTFLKVLSGAHKQSAGALMVDGVETTFASPSEAIEAGVSTVYQELSLLQNLTVTQNVWLGREKKGVVRTLDQAIMRAKAVEILQQFKLDIDPDALVGSLPVAQRQLLEIAIASSRDTKYLLLDEPTTALEGDQVQALLTYLRELADDRGIGILIVNHKLDELFSVSDRIVALMDGRAVIDAPAKTVDRHEVVAAIAGEDHAGKERGVRGQLRADRAVAMEVRDLRGGLLNGVSFDARQSEVLGIYGLGGSGRTEALRAIAGIAPAMTGQVTVGGRSFLPRKPKDSMKSGIAFLTEERKTDGIVPLMDSEVNAALPVLKRFGSFGYLHKRSMARASRQLLDSLELKGDPANPVSSLSGGNQQKVLIARALIQNPEILLLDEPSKGVDIGAKSEIHALLRKLAHEDELAIVMVSSEEEEILDVADRVLVFSEGRVAAGPIPSSELDIPTLRQLAWTESEDQSSSAESQKEAIS